VWNVEFGEWSCTLHFFAGETISLDVRVDYSGSFLTRKARKFGKGGNFRGTSHDKFRDFRLSASSALKNKTKMRRFCPQMAQMFTDLICENIIFTSFFLTKQPQ